MIHHHNHHCGGAGFGTLFKDPTSSPVAARARAAGPPAAPTPFFLHRLQSVEPDWECAPSRLLQVLLDLDLLVLLQAVHVAL